MALTKLKPTGVNASATFSVANLSVTSNVVASNANLGNLATANYFSGTLDSLSNAQPNITSLGTLTSLNVTTGNIVDLTLTKFNEKVVSSTNTGTSISPNLSSGTVFKYTANSNFSMNTLTNAVAGSCATLVITQDGTGSRILSSTMKFAGGLKTLSTAAGSIDIITVFYDGSVYYAALSKGYA